MENNANSLRDRANPVDGKLRRLFSVFAMILLTVVLAGCSDDPGAEFRADASLKVVATTAMIADAALHVGGEHVSVVALMGPGTDPHLYNASAGDVARMRHADVILYNGLHLEGKLDRVLEAVEQSKHIYAVAERIPEDLRLHASPGSSTYDPHVWFDVSRWRHVVDATEEAFVEIDPAHEADYRLNASAFRDSLASLDAWIRDTLSVVPERRRALITAHDAFAYFADAYGFEVHGLQGISTVSEAGAGDMRRIADLIAERDIPAIFVESSVSSKAIEAVQAAVRARDKQVKIGGTLFSDAMGLPGTPEGTYLGMVRHNVRTIVSSLMPDSATVSTESE
ncbi:zinc ABC transporter substrate-binding protein [bacterium]|nr:zinc ABC transporter substrate-binding protein [bacterium]